MTVLNTIGNSKWLMAGALAVGLAFGQVALAKDCDGFCPRKQAMMVEKLNLSDEQAAKFKEIMKGSYEEKQKLHDEFHDSKAFKKHLAKMDKQREATDGKLAEVLSAEQMEELKQMRMNHGMKGEGYHHGNKECPGRGMHDGKGHHHGAMMMEK